MRVHLDTNAVPAPLRSGNAGSARPQERIQNRVANEGKHADKALGQLQREWRRVVSGRSAGYARPDLLKPDLVTVRGNNAEYSRSDAWAAISPGLALHEDEFNIVLHDSIRLVGLAQETAPIALRLIHGVCDLVPDDGSQVAEPDPPAMFLNRCMKRHNGVFTLVLAT
jgi:hypothetical protein